MIDIEFIKRAEEFFKDVDIHYEKNIGQKRYFNSAKGKFAKSLGDYKRRKRVKDHPISWEEKQKIGNFYKNCPEGYEVDHIYPLARGGLHTLSNLQYLTKEENRKKGCMLPEFTNNNFIAKNITLNVYMPPEHT